MLLNYIGQNNSEKGITVFIEILTVFDIDNNHYILKDHVTLKTGLMMLKIQF